MSEGTGTGNCYDEDATVTRDPGSTSNATLYPACATPRPANGTDSTQQAEIIQYVVQTSGQEDSWSKHAHTKVGSYKPIDGQPVQ
jgi:hypothetical protein